MCVMCVASGGRLATTLVEVQCVVCDVCVCVASGGRLATTLVEVQCVVCDVCDVCSS